MEIWKDIIGYEGLYQVSNLGNVKSMPKEWIVGIGKIRKHNGKILKNLLSANKYYHVKLCKDNKAKAFSVHQLVAIHFLGHIPCGHKLVVDHINDDKLDNRVENLNIVSQRENSHKTQGKYASKYKGVSWCKKSSKWRSRIELNGKSIHLGRFDSEYEAHLKYQKALHNIK